ncbi:hypothetical protein [Paraprevotella clara]|uniref:hypothetical protein n=1 Tax=Paraprevotella clara TaxID=454154 RepID=UPI00402A2970
MSIRKLSYVFLLCLSAFALTGCEDNEDGGLPQTVKSYGPIEAETLNWSHWKWGIGSHINDGTSTTFVCNRDSVGGGYAAAFTVNEPNSSTMLTFFVDDQFDVTAFFVGTSSKYNADIYTVRQNGGNIYLTGNADGETKHSTYALQFPYGNPASSDPFAAVAASVLSFCQNINFLSERLGAYGRDFIYKAASGDYATQPIYKGQTLLPIYDAVCDLNNLDAIRRQIMGESTVDLDPSAILYGKGTDGKSYVTVRTNVYAPAETFNRTPDTGVYGSSKPLRLYCGLLVGQHNVLGAGNALYDLKGEEVFSGKEQSQTFELPDLAPGIYYVRPYLIAEDELQAQATGKANPRLLLYAEDTRAYLALDARLGEIEMTDCYYVANQGVSADLRIPVSVPKIPDIPLSYNNTFTHGSWGIAILFPHNDFSETSIFNRMEAFNGVLEASVYPLTRDFQVDHENFIAKVDLEAALFCYAGNERIILDSRPFTVVYDKKPELRFTSAELVQDFYPQGGDPTKTEDAIRSEQIISGAFWFESDIKSMEEHNGHITEMGSRFRQDFREPQIETDFYRHFLTYDIKTEKLYMETVVNGQPFRSNALHYTWSDDGSRIIRVEVEE